MKKNFTLLIFLSFMLASYAQSGVHEKSATPKGYGNDHYIEADTDITYIIRFQNIGTDTAYNIKVMDTLSFSLDPSSVRPGESSHEYEFEMDGRTAVFLFGGIKLPGSDVNKELSKAYVSFTVSQSPNLPLETVILNRAAIYMDFYAPSFTNEYFHTVGYNFLPSTTVTVLRPDVEVKVFPNPISEQAIFDLEATRFSKGEMVLFERSGKMVDSQVFDSSRFTYQRKDLPSGNYFFKLLLDGEHVASGQILMD